MSPTSSSGSHGNPVVLAAIVALAFVLRVYGISTLPHNFDEPQNIRIIDAIDVAALELPLHAFQHPPLSVYVLKVGVWLFGANDFGYRIANVVVGALSVLLVHALAVRGGFGATAGWMAALILATNRFHIGWSRHIDQEVLYLALVAATLLAFWRLYRRGSGWTVWAAALVLALLAKEAAVLVLPPLALFLLTRERGRALLRRREAVWAVAAVAAIGGAMLVWALMHLSREPTHGVGNLFRLASFGPRIEPFEFFLGPSTTYDAPLPDTWVYPSMFRVTGAILLASVAWSWWRRCGDDFVRLMLVVFAFHFGVFSLFGHEASRSVLHRGEFWWCDAALIPATVLAARALVDLREAGRGTATSRAALARWAFRLVPVYLLANAAFFVAVTKDGPILNALGLTYTDVVRALPFLF